MADPCYVYIIECGDGSFYTGQTNDVERRLSEHRNGTGAKYTRGRKPLTLRYVEECEDRSSAMSREYEIKQLSHDQKANLVELD
jgi:putative endonuclease